MMIGNREYRVKVDAGVIRHIPIINNPPPSPVFYSLFERKVTGEYIQIRSAVYTSEMEAFRVFRDAIAKAPLSLSIRKARVKRNRAQGVSRFRGESYNEWRDSPLREREKRVGKFDWKKAQANDKD